MKKYSNCIIDKQEFYILYGETFLKLIATEKIDSSYITYAAPIKYEDQVPLFLEIKSDTSPKISNYRLIDDKNSPNKLIKFEIDSLKKNENIMIHFSYWVLVKNRRYKDIQKNVKIQKEDELPESLKKWILSTEAIQTKNFLIKIKAKTIHPFNKKLLVLAKRIFFIICYNRLFLSKIRDIIEKTPFLRKIILPKKYWTGLMDAVSSLIFGGLCAAKANLQVALFRANGVPSRILIANPIHYYSKKIDWIDALHYVVEFYVPNYGWVRGMSGRVPYQPKNDIILRLVYPEDENEAGNGLSYYGGMEPWFWFSDDKIKLDFPDEIFKLYKKTKDQGIPITTGKYVCNFKIEDELADEIFNLSKQNWDQFINNFSKKIDRKNFEIYNEAIRFQKKGLQDLIKMEYDKFTNDLKKANELFSKIKN